MLGQQAHVGRIAVVGGDIERRRADIGQVVPAQLDQRRVLHRAAFLVELLLLPLDPDVGVGAVLQQRLRQLERGQLPVGTGGPCGVLPTPAAPSAPGFRSQASVCSADPRWSGSIRIGAVIEQRRRQFEIGVDDRHVQRARAVGRDVVDVGAVRQQRLDRVDTAVADGEQKPVKPAFDFALTSAPNSSSIAAAAALPAEAAHISAVCPFTGSRACTLAPCASSTFIASTLPVSDAVISAVWPSSEVLLGSAPAFSRRSMIAAFPFLAASDSGVTL